MLMFCKTNEVFCGSKQDQLWRFLRKTFFFISPSAIYTHHNMIFFVCSSDIFEWSCGKPQMLKLIM